MGLRWGQGLQIWRLFGSQWARATPVWWIRWPCVPVALNQPPQPHHGSSCGCPKWQIPRHQRRGTLQPQTAGKNIQLPWHWSGIVLQHLNSLHPQAIQSSDEFISVHVSVRCLCMLEYISGRERVAVCVCAYFICLIIFLLSGETVSSLCGFVSNYRT